MDDETIITLTHDQSFIIRMIDWRRRQRTICPEDCFRLILAWSRMHALLMVLHLIFVMTMSPIKTTCSLPEGL
jgi:hypothetical protein